MKTLNLTLRTMPRIERLQTLLHECVHHWQHVYHSGTVPRTPWYHGVVWAKKAAEVGIIANPVNGCTVKIVEPFISLVREVGVTDRIPDYATVQVLEVQEYQGSVVTPGGRPGGLKKWTCECSPPVRIWVGRKEVRVRCQDCGARFRTQPGTHPGGKLGVNGFGLNI